MGNDFDIDRLSKRRIVTIYEDMQRLSQKHLQLSYQIAVELYRYNPEANIFTGDTFVDESRQKIQDGCAVKYACGRHGKWLWAVARWLIHKAIPRRQKNGCQER